MLFCDWLHQYKHVVSSCRKANIKSTFQISFLKFPKSQTSYELFEGFCRMTRKGCNWTRTWNYYYIFIFYMFGSRHVWNPIVIRSHFTRWFWAKQTHTAFSWSACGTTGWHPVVMKLSSKPTTDDHFLITPKHTELVRAYRRTRLWFY